MFSLTNIFGKKIEVCDSNNQLRQLKAHLVKIRLFEGKLSINLFCLTL